MLSATMNVPSVEMSLEEWAAMDEDAEGELVDGILVEEEMPGMSHELTVSWLIQRLGSWLSDRGGFVFGSGGNFGS